MLHIYTKRLAIFLSVLLVVVSALIAWWRAM